LSVQPWHHPTVRDTRSSWRRAQSVSRACEGLPTGQWLVIPWRERRNSPGVRIKKCLRALPLHPRYPSGFRDRPYDLGGRAFV
jgi:hypothetical protein